MQFLKGFFKHVHPRQKRFGLVIIMISLQSSQQNQMYNFFRYSYLQQLSLVSKIPALHMPCSTFKLKNTRITEIVTKRGKNLYSTFRIKHGMHFLKKKRHHTVCYTITVHSHEQFSIVLLQETHFSNSNNVLKITFCFTD